MIAAVVDPSVLVSGFIGKADASPGQIRAAWRDGQFKLVVSPKLITELEDVLGRPKFGKWASDGRGYAYVGLVRALGAEQPDPAIEVSELRDANDDYLLALARFSGADAIVSLDLDLLDAGLEDVTVYRPRTFLDLLAGQQARR